MPQLDLDLLEDFLFFAFAAFLLGFGDTETEENAVERGADAHLAHFYLAARKSLHEEVRLVARTVKALPILVVFWL
jgi:hypothetical protein